jgi:D-alanyl-D-alanine carboxypeptidase
MQRSIIMSNNSTKIATALFTILAVPGAAFARGGGFAPAGQMGARAAAINAANSVLTDPSGIGNANRVTAIPPPRITVPPIPQFK